ncbi:hypothetical protein GPECTOR_61g830 [Gonium pectorale]|uniref:Uncharacterized protein n=1 Tax=Gonium pectorale TaxID=33097 RepID=A0A150G4U7_GONPE|nr:hypothetical protein GPECTOR_61g830 [Gonium pectorale]|eukprot:KXZ44877.1 hypothetical protein GPECTOR_61g830 [Gonium pectorale]
MSLEDLIKKRTSGEAKRGGRGGGRNGGAGGLSVRDGGVNKQHGDRKPFSPNKEQGHPGTGQGQQHHQQHHQQFGQAPRGGFGGGRGFGRRGGFGGRMGGGRQHFDAQRVQQPQPPAQPKPAGPQVVTYLDDATGNVVVKQGDVEVVTVAPSGHITLKAGGWINQRTLDTMNKALGVLQISVTATGDVREGNWSVKYGSLMFRFREGLVLHPKNPAAAAQRAPIVLAAMTGPPAAAAGPAAYAPMAAALNPFSAQAASMFMQSAAPSAAAMAPMAAAAGLGALGGAANQFNTAAAAQTAALVLARARAALGAAGAGLGSATTTAAAAAPSAAQTQQQYALAALSNPALLAGLMEQAAAMDPDTLRRLKAQGRA